jgi:hypothetical protein
MDQSLPLNWPEYVRYIGNDLIYSPTLQSAHQQHHDALAIEISLNFVKKSCQNLHKTTPNPLVEIQKITSQEHPAFGEYGLFATQDLYPNQHIGDYVGVVSNSTNESKTSHYILGFGQVNGEILSIDAELMGNETRMINDYRGISKTKKPNVIFEQYRHEDALRMGIFVVNAGNLGTFLGMTKQEKLSNAQSIKITKGTELLLSYGKGFWKNIK